MSNKMTKCKTCNTDVSVKAKSCPNCGAKIKKPVYKKWWFWLVVIILFFVIIGSSGGDDDTTETTVSDAVVLNTDTEKIEITTKENDSISLGKINALASAKSYLRVSAFSYNGLIEQLEFEGYSSEEAKYAVDNCEADWNEQAAKSAKNYLRVSSFSRSGLIEQLEFEGFTHEQAVYGAEAVGY